MIKVLKNGRGFNFIEFTDRSRQKCSLQESSLATEPCIWLGVDNANPQVLIKGTGWVPYPIHDDVVLHTRMHLTVDQVRELIPILQKFVETGSIEE